MSKKAILIVTILVAAVAAIFPVKSCAQKGQAVVGVESGYTTENKSAIAGIFFQYGFSNSVRIAPAVGTVFRHHDLDCFYAEINFHFPFRVESDRVTLYPIAGLRYASWDRHNLKDTLTDDVSTRVSRFCGNLGAGFDVICGRALKIKFEATYSLTTKYSTFTPSLGIGYIF